MSTIEVAKTLQDRLEKNVRELVDAFEDVTGLTVTNLVCWESRKGRDDRIQAVTILRENKAAKAAA